jgi:hypothetical protein
VNKKVLVIALAVAMLALPMSAVLATKPTEIVYGHFSVNPAAMIQTPVKTPTGKSPISIVDFTGTACQTWTGDISGVADYSARWVFHGEMFEEGSFITHHGLYIFDETTVTVGDVTAVGALVIKAAGNKAHVPGVWRVISSDLVAQGTEQPISLHGEGEFLVAGMFDYDVVGEKHFDP